MKQLGFLAALIVLANSARADQLLVTSSKDNTLYQDNSGALSNGKGENFFAGRSGMTGLIRRGVIAFDVSAIPQGSTITSVTLQLNCSQANANSANVRLHRALANWGEGTSVASGLGSGSGVPSTAGDATWIHTFYPSTLWTSAGGDFDATVSGSQIVTAAGTYTFASQAGMVGDVQFWLDHPTQNFGWCVLGDESAVQTVKRFETRESANSALRPLLTVDFVPPVTTYCTAKTNSAGCTPVIGSIGSPSVSGASSFHVTASNELNNKSGLFFYGLNGQLSSPFQGGYLCVKAPTTRTFVQDSGGNPPPNDCSGNYAIDFGAYIASGANPSLVTGAVLDGQYWGRDDGFAPPNNTSLSDAIHILLVP